MKFASGFEILEYCQTMAEKSGFYDHCLFHTTVERTEWDEATGRWTVYTDRGDAMRARYVVLANGILTTPKLARIEGMETLQGPVVPHLALGLQHRPQGQARRHHRHRRHRRAGDPRNRQGGEGALRLPAHALDHRRARPARDDAGGDRGMVEAAGLGEGAARAAGDDFGRAAPRCRPTMTSSPARSTNFKARKQHERELTPDELMPEAAQHQLPHHGADPRAGGRDRQGSEDGRGAEALLPLRLQAADLPRRIPADLQPAACDAGRHRAERRRQDQRNAAWCTTARSIRSTC